MSAATAPSALASTSVSSGSSWDSASDLTTKERLSHFEQHNPEVENKTGIHSTEKVFGKCRKKLQVSVEYTLWGDACKYNY